MPDPTPKLTAECACGRSTRCCPAWKLEDSRVRRQAFEEAAEAAPEIVKLIANEGLFQGPFASGYDTVEEAERLAVGVVADAIRALAKEKGG